MTTISVKYLYLYIKERTCEYIQEAPTGRRSAVDVDRRRRRMKKKLFCTPARHGTQTGGTHHQERFYSIELRYTHIHRYTWQTILPRRERNTCSARTTVSETWLGSSTLRERKIERFWIKVLTVMRASIQRIRMEPNGGDNQCLSFGFT